MPQKLTNQKKEEIRKEYYAEDERGRILPKGTRLTWVQDKAREFGMSYGMFVQAVGL